MGLMYIGYVHEFKPSGEHVYNYIATLGQASTGVLNFIFCGAALAALKYFVGLTCKLLSQHYAYN